MGSDLDKLAIEAEADRLSGVYLRVLMLAKAAPRNYGVICGGLGLMV
jgi:hypothetical protein